VEEKIRIDGGKSKKEGEGDKRMENEGSRNIIESNTDNKIFTVIHSNTHTHWSRPKRNESSSPRVQSSSSSSLPDKRNVHTHIYSHPALPSLPDRREVFFDHEKIHDSRQKTH
jgi:hypothetical protein